MINQSKIKLISLKNEVKERIQHDTFHPLLNRFRDADKQQAILREALFESNEVKLCLAVDKNTIIGYTVVLPPEKEERWSQLPFVRVLGVVEVAPLFRRGGLAKKLVQTITSFSCYEQKIIISLEYYWHWDLQMTDGDFILYGKMLRKMLQASRFEEISTDEPDIADYKQNFMMARIGRQITDEQLYQFLKLANPYSLA